jgi:DNA-binding MarR family transcriptional regulator
MHFLAFAFKRAHYTSLRLGRKYASPFALTPARFDMLYAIRFQQNQSQASIARLLGVAGVTVSRMLRKLEALGLIRRATWLRLDRRKKLVSITALGKKLLSLTTRKMKRKPMQRAFMRVIPPDERFDAFMAVDELHSTVQAMMTKLGDCASLQYPTWHPDD